MRLKSFARKAIPFVVTFAFGVLAASLFAGIFGGYRFGINSRHRHCEESYRIRVERAENETTAPREVITDESVIVSNNPSTDSNGNSIRKAPIAVTSNR
jgi:hypothetical protein